MREASVSIPSNIAERNESESNKLAIRYFNISKGSSAELITQSIISLEIGYISKEQCVEIIKKLKESLKC
jgi:four helix bundle protein